MVIGRLSWKLEVISYTVTVYPSYRTAWKHPRHRSIASSTRRRRSCGPLNIGLVEPLKAWLELLHDAADSG